MKHQNLYLDCKILRAIKFKSSNPSKITTVKVHSQLRRVLLLCMGIVTVVTTGKSGHANNICCKIEKI